RQALLAWQVEQAGARVEPGAHVPRRAEVHGPAAVAPRAPQHEAPRDPDPGRDPPARPLHARQAPGLALDLAEQRAVLQHTVEVDGHGDHVQRAPRARLAPRAQQVVEQAQLGLAEAPVARQAALQEDALRHAVARDELDIALEHGVVERLAVAA